MFTRSDSSQLLEKFNDILFTSDYKLTCVCQWKSLILFAKISLSMILTSAISEAAFRQAISRGLDSTKYLVQKVIMYVAVCFNSRYEYDNNSYK